MMDANIFPGKLVTRPSKLLNFFMESRTVAVLDAFDSVFDSILLNWCAAPTLGGNSFFSFLPDCDDCCEESLSTGKLSALCLSLPALSEKSRSPAATSSESGMLLGTIAMPSFVFFHCCSASSLSASLSGERRVAIGRPCAAAQCAAARPIQCSRKHN